MYEIVHICRLSQNNTLITLDVKKLWCELDEEIMEVYAIYNGKRYNTRGGCYMSYIVIE